MRLVFMGTPAFAVAPLEALIAAGHEVSLVVTQPDRAAGRGRRAVAPPVKLVAVEHGISVIQPQRLRDENVLGAIEAVAPDAIVVAAFGQILPRSVLAVPRLGCINVHASLLPLHRGPAPIPAAILAGDEVTGVTIMLMDPGLDTGDILAQAEERIQPSDTAGNLGERLSRLGTSLLASTLPRWAEGELRPVPQRSEYATYAPQLNKEDGVLDWRQPAERLWRQVRALNPWPGAFTTWKGSRLKVHEAVPLTATRGGVEPGTVEILDMAEVKSACPYPQLLPDARVVLAVVSGDGALALLTVQGEGRKAVRGDEFARGHREVLGSIVGLPLA